MTGLEPKRYDCVIWGGYARGNTGDELCLAAALQRARREFGPAVAILSHDPEYTAWLFPEAQVVPFVPVGGRSSKRWRKFWQKCGRILPASRGGQMHPDLDPESEWKACLRSARRLYLAGGGYLTDLWSLDSILAPLEFAVQLKLPVSTAPLGIGPFKSGPAADRVADILRQVDLKVRDQDSHDFCRARGLQAILASDDVFNLDWLPFRTERQRGDGPRKIGVCIFRQYGQDAEVDLSGWWTECLRGLGRQHPEHEIEGFCFHTGLQEEFRQMVRLFRRAGLSPVRVLAPRLDFRAATAAIREYDFIISARFHAVVVANVLKIPNIAIATGAYYRVKMNAAVSGHEHLSALVDPVCAPPEVVLGICHRELARAASACS